ncbi:SDR family oxidoreductase [Pedobacter nutrimenti]|uniref:dTDP-4-dehydrorhamnose reductase n=1 Tax=Pedobacter nutrimenti TaxID=1241337 RepID=A0A318UCI4_9SPHI|nr:SDR family oxidoreductase [Pedobacter nutrimenti]PYF74142.1 dTDP-4-dehydrorhamnose reductase [Pedobacter nutrimenti]
MQTILVTGSNGLTGQKITENVIASGKFNLIATSKGKNRFPVQNGYQYEEMDILDKARITALVEKYRPDAIIHTAAMTNVDTAENNKQEADRLNVEAVKLLMDICNTYHIQLVHLSTDFIFDGEDGPYDEQAAANPLSYYGKTKLQAEELLKASGVKWAILRTILVYGIVKDMSRSNIVLWAKGALEKGSPLNVVNDQWRMPTLAEDLAEACLLAVEKKAQGIYNVSGKDMMSIAELVYRVADFWKLDKSQVQEVSSASLGQQASRPRRTGFILDKTIRELGYQPHSFEQGLELLNKQLG